MPKPNVREKLINAALATFHRCGFNHCSVEDIARSAEVPKGSFYNHFESKEAIGVAVLDRYWEGCAARLQLLSERDIAPRERLHRYFRCISETVAGWDHRGCLIGNFGTELSGQSRLIRDRLSLILAGWTRAIEICVRDAQRAGEIESDLDANILAAFLVNAWEGIALRAKVDQQVTPFDQFEKVVFSKVISSRRNERQFQSKRGSDGG